MPHIVDLGVHRSSRGSGTIKISDLGAKSGQPFTAWVPYGLRGRAVKHARTGHAQQTFGTGVSTANSSKSIKMMARAVNISGDAKLVVAAFEDGAIRWLRLSDGNPLLDGGQNHPRFGAYYKKCAHGKQRCPETAWRRRAWWIAARGSAPLLAMISTTFLWFGATH
jgi:hypothetical protein